MRTKTTALCMALAAVCLFNGCVSRQSGRSNATMKTADGPLLQAHRGGKNEYDDNALGGFKRSLENGVRGFETDIRFTKDRHLVIMHDDRVNRTTDGKGIVEAMTLDELRKCRLRRCSEPVPTLEELLAVFKGRDDIFFELEMKAYPGAFYTPEVLEDYCRKLSETARRMMAPGTYAFTCFDTTTLATMRRVAPWAPTGLITGKGLDDSHIAAAKSLGCIGVAPSGHPTTKEMVDKAHAAGLSVCLWMCQSKADWDEYKSKGADRATSDNPVRILGEVTKGK